jgi:hypothetical protein
MTNTPARKERLRAKRMAAIEDRDYTILAWARMGLLTKKQRAVVYGRPVYSWYWNGENVDARLRRMHKLGWVRVHPHELRFPDYASPSD